MKIELRQLSDYRDVIIQSEENPSALDLGTSGILINEPVKIRAAVSKIENSLNLKVNLQAKALGQCSRCLTDIALPIAKDFRLNIAIGKSDTSVDINEDIRQEIILEYPDKPLCKDSCLGLCVNCGRNLNEGNCNCAPPMAGPIKEEK